jgi:GAF domain-containing protein
MKGRSRAVGKVTKARSSKALKLRGRKASKAVRRGSPPAGQKEIARLTRELNEAQEQQTATSEVLQVISSSPGDLQPVFEAMLEKAVRICDAKFGNIYRWENDTLRFAAAHNIPTAYTKARRSARFDPASRNPLTRAVSAKELVHIPDMKLSEAYRENDPITVAAVDLAGTRTFLAVPLLKEDELVGLFTLGRQKVRPFTEKQIALVTNFAAQAVIAIENTRLLNELRQRTTDLTERTADLAEALKQQTATSEVLQVISSSPGDLEPVFASMLENAVRICDASFGNIYRMNAGAFSLVAAYNTPPAFAEYRKRLPISADDPKASAGRITQTKAVVHVADLRTEQAYIEGDPAFVAAAELGGVRTYLAVPMLNREELIGGLVLSRQEVRPFTDKQVALVENFAAQAVIAIENTRLLKELRERTEEVVKLNHHLEQRVADQVGEIERMGKLRRFLPPQVADLIVASGTEK